MLNPQSEELLVKTAVGNGFTVKSALVLFVVPQEFVACIRKYLPLYVLLLATVNVVALTVVKSPPAVMSVQVELFEDCCHL